ncbi:MAG: DciA family protein [Woeseiaceae bacterium]|jgi:hypothetical protein
MPIKRLESLLNPNNNEELGDIIRHAREMGDLVQILQKSLPADEANSIVAANIRDDSRLIVLVSSSAWASRLRFESGTLIAAAREADSKVDACEIRVCRTMTDS